jgi:hypothetical protein
VLRLYRLGAAYSKLNADVRSWESMTTAFKEKDNDAGERSVEDGSSAGVVVLVLALNVVGAITRCLFRIKMK